MGTPVSRLVRQGLGAVARPEEVPGLPDVQGDLGVPGRGRRRTRRRLIGEVRASCPHPPPHRLQHSTALSSSLRRPHRPPSPVERGTCLPARAGRPRRRPTRRLRLRHGAGHPTSQSMGTQWALTRRGAPARRQPRSVPRRGQAARRRSGSSCTCSGPRTAAESPTTGCTDRSRSSTRPMPASRAPPRHGRRSRSGWRGSTGPPTRNWYRMDQGTLTEARAKRVLHRGDADDLNLYIGMNRSNSLGWATQPGSYDAEPEARRRGHPPDNDGRRQSRALQLGRRRRPRDGALARPACTPSPVAAACGATSLLTRRGRLVRRTPARSSATPAPLPDATRSATSWTTPTTGA